MSEPEIIQFDGEFFTPGMGRVHQPIPVGGEGYCRIAEEGLFVHGYKTSSSSFVMLLAFVGIFVGGIALSIAFGISPEFMGGAIVAALFAVNRALGKKKASGDIMELTIPWDKIKKVEFLEDKVVLTVKKFTPKGELYFIPSQDPNVFMDIVNERRG